MDLLIVQPGILSLYASLTLFIVAMTANAFLSFPNPNCLQRINLLLCIYLFLRRRQSLLSCKYKSGKMVGGQVHRVWDYELRWVAVVAFDY